MSAAQPVYFGAAERPLSGWLHRPSDMSASSSGLVICNPFGYESICAHRTLRHIAGGAAAAGIPALRFDYDGTGDSAGSALDGNRLAAWVDSIDAAARFLCASAGVERVCVLGVRLGATLAALATAREIDSIIAVAPIVNVKAYLRELRMLQIAMDSKRNIERNDPDGILETGGFMLTAQEQADLARIDLCRQAVPRASRVLIFDRAELPGANIWAQHLRAGGARVDLESFTGYAEMMLDSHETVIPRQMICSAVDWLGTLASEAAIRSAPATRSAPALAAVACSQPITLAPESNPDIAAHGAPDVAIREMTVRFGPSPGLFGIVSAPLPETYSGTGPVKAILLLNSGAVHHIGPNRLYVAMARRWARLGHVVLRMDLSGIGDSAPRPGEPENVVYARWASEDIREAIDYLEREWLATEVHAIGLCSGAYHAFKAAVKGARLAGVVLINPLTFFWKEGMSLAFPEHRIAQDMMRYRTNIWRPESWIKLLSGRVNLWELTHVLLRRARGAAARPLRSIARKLGIPLTDDLETELDSSARAAVKLRFVFAAQDPGVELLRDQGGTTARKLRKRGALDIQMIDGADHTFTDRAARAALAAVLAAQLDSPSQLPLRVAQIDAASPLRLRAG